MKVLAGAEVRTGLECADAAAPNQFENSACAAGLGKRTRKLAAGLVA